MKFNIVYITFGNKDQANEIGKILVSERLVACVNIIDNINSIYWWDGKIQNDNEVVLIAKTRDSLVSKIIERVKSLHSYTCPCVVSLPITGGNKDFLKWIQKETQ